MRATWPPCPMPLTSVQKMSGTTMTLMRRKKIVATGRTAVPTAGHRSPSAMPTATPMRIQPVRDGFRMRGRVYSSLGVQQAMIFLQEQVPDALGGRGGAEPVGERSALHQPRQSAQHRQMQPVALEPEQKEQKGR